MYVTTSVSQLAIIYKSFLFSWQMGYIISLIFENWLLITKKIWLLIHYAHLFCNGRFVVIVTTLISLTLINSFSFSQVMPGKYHVKASHSSWTFENVSLQCITSGKLMVVNYWYVVKEKERHAGIWLDLNSENTCTTFGQKVAYSLLHLTFIERFQFIQYSISKSCFSWVKFKELDPERKWNSFHTCIS